MAQRNFCSNDKCNRKLGMIVERWHSYRFCCRACKEEFLARLTAQREKMKQWLQYLHS